MAFVLSPDISFCDAGGRLVFLNLAADRYSCLSQSAELAFMRLVVGETLSGDDRDRLVGLEHQGLLIETSIPCRPTPCASLPLPNRSAVEMDLAVPKRRVIGAALSLIRAKIEMRHRPLARLIGALGSAKADRVDTGTEDSLTQIAAAFKLAALITGSLNQCLPISIAIARRAISNDIGVDLVLGVRLRPFQAHAWVQRGDMLVSDRLNTVLPFKPILIV